MEDINIGSIWFDLSHVCNDINYISKVTYRGKERQTDEEGNNFRDVPANLPQFV